MITCKMLRVVAAGLVTVWLAACGGGGGSSDSGSAPSTFRARFDSARLDANGIAGSPTMLVVGATVPLNDPAICLTTSADQRHVLAISGFISDVHVTLNVTLRGDLAPGTYVSEVALHGYLDAACTREIPGSPARIPLHIVVEPGMVVPDRLSLTRVGGEPLPTISTVLSLPPQASGSLQLDPLSTYDPITARLEGNTLVVSGREKPAGHYTASIVVTLSTDTRHRRVVEVDYTASPPPGGEVAFAVTPSLLNETAVQGAPFSRRLRVTRPSWSSAPISVESYPSTPAFSLRQVDDDEWDLSLDAVAAGAGRHSMSLAFVLGNGPDHNNTRANATIWVNVDEGFTVGPLGGEVSSTGSTAALRFEAAVQTTDGQPARWTATTAAPELRLLRASGQTGSDALIVEVDAGVLARTTLQHEFTIDVAIDRAGVPVRHVPVTVRNNAPLLATVSPPTLMGGRGRVYVDGWFPQQELSGLLDRLRITGAVLGGASIVEDPLFFGRTNVLALDLSGAIPGQPIELRDNNSTAPALQLSAKKALQDAAGFVTLPFGSYRPGQFAPALSSFYFATDGKAFRWAWDGSLWTLTEAALEGLIDLTPAPDERVLWAVETSDALALDPLTLAVRERGVMVPHAWQGAGPADRVDGTSPYGRKALTTSADGRAFATLVDVNGYPYTGWVCSPRDNSRAPAPWLQSPRVCDAGGRPGTQSPGAAMQLVRSANGQALLTNSDEGWRNVYRASRRMWESMTWTQGERGRRFVAISDSGLRSVRDDGMLFESRLSPSQSVLPDSNTALGNLSDLLPLTHRAAGFGLSGDGGIGIVYGMRTSGSGSAERAIDAKAWIIDIRSVSAGGAWSPTVLATAVVQPLGCTTAFAIGESCMHTVAITVAPGDRTAFLVGPRGVAAVPLPEQIAAPSAAPQNRVRVRSGPGAR